MKIAHIVWAPKIGGAELFALRLAREQAGHHDVAMLFLGATDPQVQGEWSQNIKTHCFGCSGGHDLMGFMRLSRHLKRERYEVLHLHQSPIVLLFLHIAAPGSLIVKHEHGRASVMVRSRRQRFLGTILHRLVDVYIANSAYTCSRIVADEGIPPEKIEIVMGGVELGQFKREGTLGGLRQELGLQSEPIVLFLGRLVWEKGIEEFLQVARKVNERLPKVRFVIVGDGPLRNEVEARVGDLGLSGATNLLGFRNDVAAIMRDCSVFLMTSRQEAQGLTVLEAMASGLPVVSFDAGGLPEVVGEAGVLVRDRSVDEMADAAIDLLKDDRVRGALIEKSINHVASFGYPAVSRRILEIYSKRQSG